MRGLKSLKRRIAAKELVICETDKSSKLAVLSRKQYLDSGSAHCRKDLEVSLVEISRLQKYVNANVDWMHDILGTGEAWGRQERIRNSSNDQGSQVAPLRLLVKDLENWLKSSGNPPPSRPVCNGKSRYNCHLSELISMILGPVAQEAAGSEMNSTGDLLSSIKSLDSSLSQEQYAEQMVGDSEESHCDFCSKCNEHAPSEEEIRKATALIEKIDAKKVNSALNITHNLRSKLKASRAATILYHRACLQPSKSQDSSVDSLNWIQGQNSSTKEQVSQH